MEPERLGSSTKVGKTVNASPVTSTAKVISSMRELNTATKSETLVGDAAVPQVSQASVAQVMSNNKRKVSATPSKTLIGEVVALQPSQASIAQVMSNMKVRNSTNASKTLVGDVAVPIPQTSQVAVANVISNNKRQLSATPSKTLIGDVVVPQASQASIVQVMSNMKVRNSTNASKTLVGDVAVPSRQPSQVAEAKVMSNSKVQMPASATKTLLEEDLVLHSRQASLAKVSRNVKVRNSATANVTLVRQPSHATVDVPEEGTMTKPKVRSSAVSQKSQTGQKGAGTKKSTVNADANKSGTKKSAVSTKKSASSKANPDIEKSSKPGTQEADHTEEKKKGAEKSKSAGTEEKRSNVERGSKRSGSRPGTKGKGAKKGKAGKEKVKKLNRKVVYKEIKLIEKKIQEEEKLAKKVQWEKNKVLFYWNCVVGKLIDLNKRNYQLKLKQESLKMEKKHAMFHEHWKKMHQTRMEREEVLDGKRAEFRSMITKLRDDQKRQTDWLFKDIQTYVKDTYLVGQKYTSDVVGIRMEYTKKLTDTLFEARENSRILEIEQNSKFGPAVEEFEEEMRRLRSRIPTERQERLHKMLSESNTMLVELVNVYTNILHHNFIEVCHTANIINELKTREMRLEREKNELQKKRNKIKERTEYLHDRVSNLRRQVNAGKEARKKLQRVLKEQEALQRRKDIAYINKELTFQENSKLTKAITNMSDKVDKWYFQVKRQFLKTVIIEAGKFKERALQLTNYNHLVKHLFDTEEQFLESVETFKDHEEFEDSKEGLKVLLGSFRPFTLEDLEKEFEGCTESFATAIVFFKRRLYQNYLSLDDLHFFIKRRNPLSFLETSKREERALMEILEIAKRKKGSMYLTSASATSTTSFRL